MADSMTYKALIVDDEAPARSIVHEYLKDYPHIEVVGECANGFEAMKTIKELEPHLIFLDIQMPKVNGLELLEVLEDAPEVIFTTAYDDYAIKAFELNAVDYLLKPFSKERFDVAVNKVLEKLAAGTPGKGVPVEKIRESSSELLSRIVVKKGSSMTVIPLSEILFLEAQEDYVMIHSTQGRFMKNQTMSYYESHLPEKEFIRIHRSYIANAAKITKLEPYDKDAYLAVIPPDHKLRISRAGYKKLREQLGF
jgi:two-component system, LytTR family, response regulator